MFGKLKERVQAVRQAAVGKPTIDMALVASQMKVANETMKRLEAELAEQKRISLEYHNVIETLIRERDRWRDLFMDQSAAHQTAQVMLETALDRAAKAYLTVLKSYNAQQEELGKKPVLDKDGNIPEIKGLPSGTSKQFGEFVDSLKAKAPKETDGEAERQRIRAKEAKANGAVDTSR